MWDTVAYYHCRDRAAAHAEGNMKYSQYLKALDSDAPPEWRGKFLAYKRLKKMLR